MEEDTALEKCNLHGLFFVDHWVDGAMLKINDAKVFVSLIL